MHGNWTSVKWEYLTLEKKTLLAKQQFYVPSWRDICHSQFNVNATQLHFKNLLVTALSTSVTLERHYIYIVNNCMILALAETITSFETAIRLDNYFRHYLDDNKNILFAI